MLRLPTARAFSLLAITAIAVLTLASPRAGAVTPFQQDVATAINSGLAYLDTQGAYNNPSNAGWAAGITTLALLEKRASGNPSDPAQGYSGASAADQARLRRSVAYMVGLLTNNGFYAYGYGGGLSALTEYLATGGPEACKSPCTAGQLLVTPVELQNLANTVIGTVDLAVDRSFAAQRTLANGFPNDFNQGYWCYNAGNCTDSSTTQYAALGLSAARALYNNPSFGDPGARLPKIQSALMLARQAYQLHGAHGSQDINCDPNGWTYTSPNPASYPPGFVPNPAQTSGNGTPADPAASGHGYHEPLEGYAPSLQQTSSAMFVQVLGGANINDPTVQSYMRWVYDHYRYTDIGSNNGAGSLNDGWPFSYFYYLWSSFKGIEFIIQEGIAPSPGNLTTQSYGTLAGASAPVCTDRQMHRDPAVLPRVALFGAGGVGFYGAETKNQYFDYAYTLLAYQCPSGSFQCNGAATPDFPAGLTNAGSWSFPWDGNSYALLVLQRATGVLQPTATLATNHATATVGTSVTLTWTSANTTSCAASGGKPADGWTGAALAVNGNLPVSESTAGVVTYTITCSAGTQSAQASVSVTWTKPNFLLCDVDNNGQIDSRDLQMIMKLIGQHVPPAPAAADFDGNGVISINDVRNCALRCTHPQCATQ
jgi:hypothetical protein